MARASSRPANDVFRDLSRVSRRLARAVDAMRFADPVCHVYNPTTYARAPNESYLGRLQRDVDALLVGMNPGPWGMTQTGVPFGEVGLVRDWLRIDDAFDPPTHQHPSRPIEGLACKRSEVSGRRLWGWARERFHEPERFFARFAVWNYCPLVFLEDSGRNRTPDKLPAHERKPLFMACDTALAEVVAILRPTRVIGIGGFARDRARAATEYDVGAILHPSPASPAANRGWAEAAEKQLRELGIEL